MKVASPPLSELRECKGPVSLHLSRARSGRSPQMAEQWLALPPSLPLLPLSHQILLPTAIVRVQVPGSHQPSNAALLQHLAASGAREHLVAVVPALAPTASRDGGAPLQLHDIGTAARVLQLSRLVQTGDWVVLLEGICRIALLGPAEQQRDHTSTSGAFDSMRIRQLELLPPAAAPSQPGTLEAATKQQQQQQQASSPPTADAADATNSSSSAPALGVGEQQLGEELKAATRRLLQLLSAASGLPAARRLLELLSAVPAWRAADVVTAALGRNSQERLAVLLALDHSTRIRLALGLVNAALQAVGSADSGSSSSSQRAVPGGRGSRGGSAVLPSSGGAARKQQRGSGQQQQQLTIKPPLPAGARFSSSSSSGGGAGASSGPPPGMLGSGEEDEDEDDVGTLLARLAAAGPPAEVMRAALREAKRLRSGGDHQPGAAAARVYLETLADLPWNTFAWQLPTPARDDDAAAAAAGHEQSSSSSSSRAGKQQQAMHQVEPAAGAAADGEQRQQQQQERLRGPPPPLPLSAARALLDAQHAGLAKVKGRVIEHLAVGRLLGPPGVDTASGGGSSRARRRAPVLCFIGPPGVGKTSLAASIARVLGVPLSRISLGGVRDEAEIRGHRRTYVGAMPGRLVSALRKAGCRDALVLLDEVDKIGTDSHRGDPASALLEVLDPEQAATFTDTYLALPFDLSAVTFIATANRASDIPPALMDRLECIHLPGYTLAEKVSICRAHLLPSLLAEHGLGPQLVTFPQPTVVTLINGYTREAGVRGLRRCLAAICRHVALTVVLEHEAAAAAAAGSSADALPAVSGEVQAQMAAWGGSSSSSSRRRAPHVTSHYGSGDVRLGDEAAAAAAWRAALATQQQQQQQQQHGTSSGSTTCQQLLLPEELPCAVLPAAQQPASTGAWWGEPAAAAAAVVAEQTGRRQTAAQQQLLAHELHARRASAAAAGVAASGASGGAAAAVCYDGSSGPEERAPQPYPPDLLTRTQARVVVDAALVEAVLGPPKYEPGLEAATALAAPGVAAGLVWTAAGGGVQFVECIAVRRDAWWEGDAPAAARQQPRGVEGDSPGTSSGGGGHAALPLGQLTLTGQAGDVLVESARIALSWIRAHAWQLGLVGGSASSEHAGSARVQQQEQEEQQIPALPPPLLQLHSGSGSGIGQLSAAGDDDTAASSLQLLLPAAAASLALPAHAAPRARLPHPLASNPLSWDLHVHLPSGAVPKDGPSAGITLAVALLSRLSGRPVRPDTAMTGELTLSGLVLPVGGIKEKLLAARAAGLTRALVPARNMREVEANAREEEAAAAAAGGGGGLQEEGAGAGTSGHLQVIPVSRLEDVLAAAFDPPFLLRTVSRL